MHLRTHRRPVRFVLLSLAALLALSTAAMAAPPDHAQGRGKGKPPAADPGAPPEDEQAPPAAFDYTAIEGLTQAVHAADDIIWNEPVHITAHDGVELYVEITRPAGPGPYPVIFEASPYHGTLSDREGRRILPEPRDEHGTSLGLTGYFAPRGYAVAMMSLRGTGRSQGCLDHLGHDDAKDLKRVVEWLADAEWSNGKVGMTGHSYVGSTPSLAAAQNPRGLATIVPSAGLASMYHHQFQGGVPYFLQWVGPMYAYEQLALERHLPGGDHELSDMGDFGCGLVNSAALEGLSQTSGQYTQWHAQRDSEAGAAAADIPVFMVHGVNDNAARVPGSDWFVDRGGKVGDKIWLGQWDHGSGCCPTRRGIQWTYALHAWFDKHLAGSDVETGPPAELFLADGTFTQVRQGVTRTEILLTDAYPTTTSTLELFPSADGGLGTEPAEEGSVSFAGDPEGFLDPKSTGGATFRLGGVDTDVVIAGMPELDLVASVTAPRVHLIATLFDESPDGTWRRIGQFALNPELRHGLSTPALVVPGERMELSPPAFQMAHRLRAGHDLVLKVATSDPDKVPLFAVDPNVTVFTGPGGTALRLPVVDAPVTVVDDVPLSLDGDDGGETIVAGDAQAPIRETVTPLAPGAGVRVGAATSATVEFLIEDGKDNARMDILATPSAPADVDLYLEVLTPDGWVQVGSAENGGFASESFSADRPNPGQYRVEVHNWAGVTLTGVDVAIDFYNSAGEPGA